MIAIVRITGRVKVRKDIEETLSRLRLRRKFICVVIKEPTKEQLGMLKKVTDFVAYGEISEETYKKLVEKRGKKVNGKLKPFFRMNPPRGGIDSKKHFAESRKGVLGNNKDKINELIERML